MTETKVRKGTFVKALNDALDLAMEKHPEMFLIGEDIGEMGGDFGVTRKLWEKYGNEIGPRTSIMILGDARNNYHASESWIIKAMNEKARAVHWLNPEPNSYWDTGDSIVGEYAQYCDGTFEVRNLRQLEGFVDNLA